MSFEWFIFQWEIKGPSCYTGDRTILVVRLTFGYITARFLLLRSHISFCDTSKYKFVHLTGFSAGLYPSAGVASSHFPSM